MQIDIEHQLFVFVTCQFCHKGKKSRQIVVKASDEAIGAKRNFREDAKKRGHSLYRFPREGGYEVKVMLID